MNADELPAAWAWCRDMRHAWAPYTVEPATVGGGRGYRQSVRCERCRTIRRRFLDDRGRVVGGTSYVYPDGYLSPPGEGRMTDEDRAALRLRGLDVRPRRLRSVQ